MLDRGVFRMETMLDEFRAVVKSEELGVYGIHVYQCGKQSVQTYFRDDVRENLYSGSKTFTSMAIGIAAGEGRLTLTDKALDYFPECKAAASEGSGDITVHDLLQMRAGYKTSLFSADFPPEDWRRDWVELIFARPMEWKAGTHFFYDNGCTYVLSRIIEAASGQTLRDYLMPRLFEPLQIINPQWHTCAHGHSLGAVGLYLTTEEFSRLGILMLQNGMWQDKQLVPAEYLRAAVNDTVETEGFDDDECRCGYGYQLWRCTVPEAFRADGKYGQYSIVLPDREAVITVTAHNERCANDILRAVWTCVLPKLT